jgi:serine/threonine protein kinase
MASGDRSSATSASTAVRRHHASCLPWCPTRAHPKARNQPKAFWVTGQRDILFHECSPWHFYEPFASCESDASLVLCNERTEVRVMKTYNVTCADWSLPQMQHQNIINIYEVYHFKSQIFIISEYLDFSLEDLLRHDIHLTETEIACVISQVRVTPHLYQVSY